MKRLYTLAFPAALLFCAFNTRSIQTPVKATILKPDTIVLPDSYKNRHFLSNPDFGSPDPASIPGNILRYTASAPGGSEIATLKAIIKGNKPAVEQKLTGATVYKGQVLPESSINGSDLVAGLIAEKGKVIDMEIRDDATYSVPDGQIDTAAIKTALQSVSVDDQKKLFYITSVRVSVVTYKVHTAPTAMDKLNKVTSKVKAGKPDIAKNGVYYKVKPSKTPSPYSGSASDSKTLTEKALSVQLIPVNDIINAPGKK